jgi:hypothetical protein
MSEQVELAGACKLRIRKPHRLGQERRHRRDRAEELVSLIGHQASPFSARGRSGNTDEVKKRDAHFRCWYKAAPIDVRSHVGN